MIKKFGLAVSAVAVVGLVAACSPGGGGSKATSSGSAAGATSSGTGSSGGTSKSLTVWTSITGAQADVMKAYNTSFEKSHPGSKITIVSMADADLKTKVQAALVAKDLPDITQWYGGSFLAPLVSGGGLVDLKADIDSDAAWKANLNTGALTSYTSGGKVYAVPVESPVVQLFVNKSVTAKAGITAPPTTFTDLLTDVAKLKAKGYIPITLDGQDGWPLQEWFTYLAMRNGASITQALAGKQSWDSAPFVKAATQLRQLISAGAFQKGYLGTGYDAAYANYYGQRAGMILSGSWILSSLVTPANKSVLANTVFTPFPSTGGGGSQSEAQGGPNAAFGVTSNSHNQSLSWQWIKGLTSAETAATTATKSLILVPNKITYTKAAVPALYNQLVSALSGYTSYNLFWNEILPPTQNTEFTNLQNKLATGGTTPQKMMSDFAAYMKSHPVNQ